jgi:hypothetical protein
MMKLNRLTVLAILVGAVAGGLLAADTTATPAAKPGSRCPVWTRWPR